MKVLNLLTSGGVGGIEILCRDIALKSNVNNCFCFLFGEGMIYDQMSKSGLEVYSFGTKKISTEKYQKLKKIAASCDIIVVHHDDPFLQMYYLALMRAFPKKRFISMVHHCYDPVADNLGYGFVKRNVKKLLITKVLSKSNKVIFVSKAGYKSYSDSFSIDDQLVNIVYNGISEAKLDAGKLAKKNTTDIVHLAYVGRLVKLKGVDKLIEVLPLLVKDYEFQVSIVGDGPCRNELEDRVRTLGLSEKVTFFGFQENVNPYLEKADIFVYPSNTEIFGISIVEAMAFKCICVASNVGGIPEIINDGVNGYLNIDNTVDGLYKAIVNAMMAYHDDKKAEIINAARKTSEGFSINETIVELENIYSELIRN